MNPATYASRFAAFDDDMMVKKPGARSNDRRNPEKLKETKNEPSFEFTYKTETTNKLGQLFDEAKSAHELIANLNNAKITPDEFLLSFSEVQARLMFALILQDIKNNSFSQKLFAREFSNLCKKIKIDFNDTESFINNSVGFLEKLLNNSQFLIFAGEDLVLSVLSDILMSRLSSNRVSTKDEVSATMQKIEMLDRACATKLPKNTANLGERLSDFTPIDVKNIFSSRSNLAEIGFEAFKMKPSVGSRSKNTISKAMENLKQKQSEFSEDMRKLEKKGQKRSNHKKTQEELNIDQSILSTQKGLDDLLKQKSDLLETLSSLESQISISTEKITTFKKQLYSFGKPVSKQEDDSVLKLQKANSKLDAEKSILDELSILERSFSKNISTNDSNEMTPDDEDKLLTLLDKHLNVAAFCFKYIDTRKKSIQNEEKHIHKLMHGKKTHEHRIENLEQRLAEMEKEIADETKAQEEIKQEASKSVETAGYIIFSKFQKNKQLKKELLTIWRIRSNSKILDLEQLLGCERFEDLLPENIGKIKVEKKKPKTFNKPKAEMLDLTNGSSGKPEIATSTSSNSSVAAVLPTPTPAAVPLKTTSTKAWGGWGAAPRAAASTGKSFLEIQQEEEEQLKQADKADMTVEEPEPVTTKESSKTAQVVKEVPKSDPVVAKKAVQPVGEDEGEKVAEETLRFEPPAPKAPEPVSVSNGIHKEPEFNEEFGDFEMENVSSNTANTEGEANDKRLFYFLNPSTESSE